MAVADFRLRGAVTGLDSIRGPVLQQGPADRPNETGRLAANGNRIKFGHLTAGRKPAIAYSSNPLVRDDRRVVRAAGPWGIEWPSARAVRAGGRKGSRRLFFSYQESESRGISGPLVFEDGHDRVKKLFFLAKSAVDEELGIKESVPARLPANANNGSTSSAATNGTTAGAPTASPSASNTPRPASQAQVRAIRVLCEKLRLDAETEIRDRFNCGLAEVTLSNASTMIDDLKSRPTSNSK